MEQNQQEQNTQNPQGTAPNPVMQSRPELPPPNTLATASFILGIIALVTTCCIYGGLILGAIGIALALLSRGSETRFSDHARFGLIFSSIALGLTTLFLILIYMTVLITSYPFS